MSETKKTETKKANGETKAKPKAKKQSKPSSVDSPVRVMRELCERMKGAKRAEVIKAAVAKGINVHTAATQYQLWKNPKAKKAAAK